MSFSKFLADRIRQRLSSRNSVVEKRMMGGLIFMVNEKMCIGVDVDRKNGQDRLMVRIGKDAYEGLLKKKGCREMDFTGKPMNGFLFIYPERFDGEKDLDFWVDKALEFNKEAIKLK